METVRHAVVFRRIRDDRRLTGRKSFAFPDIGITV